MKQKQFTDLFSYELMQRCSKEFDKTVTNNDYIIYNSASDRDDNLPKIIEINGNPQWMQLKPEVLQRKNMAILGELVNIIKNL